MPRILVVDDDAETCKFLEELLESPDRQFVSVQDPDTALMKIRHDSFDLLISDINLNAPRSGLDLLRRFKADQGAPVVLISGFGTLETAIEAVRAGAFDYISKPFVIADVKRIVDRALEQGTRQGGAAGRDARRSRREPHRPHGADAGGVQTGRARGGLGRPRPHRRRKRLGKGARRPGDPQPQQTRAREPFVGINCGAIADTLLESELFGHQRGSFTGAVSDHKGVFEQAGGGTVLLDEIGDTTAALQVRLLRVLEEGEVRPVGGNRSLRVTARVIAATNMPLEQAVAEGAFGRTCTTGSASSSFACRRCAIGGPTSRC